MMYILYNDHGIHFHHCYDVHFAIVIMYTRCAFCIIAMILILSITLMMYNLYNTHTAHFVCKMIRIVTF